MKKIIFSAIFLAQVITACTKKSNTGPDTSKATLLITRITNNTAGESGYSQALAEFAYDGKQLTQAKIYSYDGTKLSNTETHTFNYNTQGQLTGSTITHSVQNSYDYVSSTVTYTGNNISKITFYKTGNVVGSDNTLSYSGDKLTRWFNPNNVDLAYSYDNSGNNIKQVATEYVNGKADGSVYTDQYTTFDSKRNLTAALPNWIYFRVCNQEEGLGYIPGTNNPLTGSEDGTNVYYSYGYNIYNYPSGVSIVSGVKTTSYTYGYKIIDN